MFKKIFSVILVLSLSLSCASAKTKTVLLEKSHKKKPKWIISLPQESSNLYFMGTKSKAPSYEAGVQAALNGALGEVMMNIGFSFAMQTEIVTRIEGDKDLSSFVDKINQSGKVELKGHRVKEIYFEKYRDTSKIIENNMEKKVEETYYDVYVLLKYSKSEIKKEREKKERQDRENVRLAGVALDAGKELLEQGQAMEAYKKYAGAAKTLSAQAGIPLFNKALASIKDLVENLDLKALQSETKKEILFKVSYETEDTKAPAARVSADTSILMGDGEIDGSVTTGLDGIGKCTIHKMTFSGGLAQVKITLNPAQFLLPLMDTAVSVDEKNAIEETIKAKSITVSLKASAFGASRVCVILWENGESRNKEVESLITEALTNSGINVVIPKSLTADLGFSNFDSPEFYSRLSAEGISTAVIGQTEAADNGKIYSMQSVLGSIDARVIDIKNQQVLTTITKSVPKAGISFSQAKQMSFKALVDMITPTIISTVSAE